MRKLLSFLAILLSVALNLGALPHIKKLGDSAPSSIQSFYLDLDTAEGSFSQWRQEGLASLNTLSATIRVPRLRKDRKWGPVFAIWLKDTEVGNGQRLIGVRLTAPENKPPLEVEIIQLDNGKLVSSETLPIKVGLNEDLQVEMVWATPHSVTVKIGENETRTIALQWSVEGIVVSASTGQMKIDPLTLGRTQLLDK